MAEGNTLATIMERVAAALAPRDDLPTKLTATGGDTTSLIDTDQSFSSGDDSAFDGNWWAYITTDAGGSNAAPEGEFARIASFDYSGGDWTLGATLTAAIASGDTAILLPVHPDELIEAINDVQRTCLLPRYGVVSLTADPNMDDSGVTGYTTIGGATPTKTTTVVYTGTQALQVVSGGTAGDGVRAEGALEGNVDADETQTFYVSVIFYISAGTWKIAITDLSTDIKSVTITAAQGLGRWLEARFEQSMESGDIAATVEATAVTASGGDIITVDSISLLSPDAPLMKLPSQVADASHVSGVFRIPQGRNTAVGDVFLPFGKDMEQTFQGYSLRDYEAVHSHRISVRPRRDPLWIKYMAAGSTLSSTTDTSDVPLEIMIEGVRAFLWQKKAARTRNRALKAEYEQEAVQRARVYDRLLLDRGLGKPRIVTPPPRKVMV